METFSALLAISAGNSPVTGKFLAQRPVTQSFDIFFDLRLDERLSKQSWGWWSETPSSSLWRHCNDILTFEVLSPPESSQNNLTLMLSAVAVNILCAQVHPISTEYFFKVVLKNFIMVCVHWWYHQPLALATGIWGQNWLSWWLVA